MQWSGILTLVWWYRSEMASSYHDVSTPHSPAASRGRKSSLCSEDFKEHSGKLNIGHNAQHKKRLKFEKFSRTYAL